MEGHDPVAEFEELTGRRKPRRQATPASAAAPTSDESEFLSLTRTAPAAPPAPATADTSLHQTGDIILPGNPAPDARPPAAARPDGWTPTGERGIGMALTESARYVSDALGRHDVDPGFTTEYRARPGRRPQAAPTTADIVRGQPSFAADATRTAATPTPPPKPSHTIPFDDPAAIATARATAQRIAAGHITTNPATGQPYTPEDRAKAIFVDHNLRVRQERESYKGDFQRRALDAFATGHVNDQAYIDTQSAAETGDLVTMDDLDQLGIFTKSGDRMRTEPTFGENVRQEMAPGAVGQLPYYLLPFEGAATAALGKAATKVGARGIGEALTLAAENEVPTATSLAGRAGQRAVIGGAPGMATGTGLGYATERARGAEVAPALEAGIEGSVVGGGLGAVTHVLGGAAADLLRPAVRSGISAFNDRFRIAPPAVRLAEASRAAEGKLPLADQMPEAHARIGVALQNLLDQRVGESRAAGTSLDEAAAYGASQPEPLIQPGQAFTDRNATPDQSLPTAADVAQRRAMEPLPPSEEANAVRQMERQQAADAAAATMAQEDAARMAADPNVRLEQAAQARPSEQQGPRTLGETLAQASGDAKAGDPLAAEYHDAVNKVVDAMATVQDAGEKGPSTRAQIALARAKASLDDVRQKYGRQFGASAVLALAANNDDLTDEEKKMVGLGALAIGSTTVVHALGEDTARELRGIVEAHPNTRTVREWLRLLQDKATNGVAAEHENALLDELGGTPRLDTVVSRDEVLQALSHGTGVATPVPAGLREEVRLHIENQARTNDVRHAADWMNWGQGAGMNDAQLVAWSDAMRAHDGFDERTNTIGRNNALDALDRISPDPTSTAVTAPPPEPVGRGKFVSRLRGAVEALPGKRWDEPVPAADWIGKLKGTSTFKKEELALLMPHLEAAQAGKMKLSRADVLNMVDENVPKIERVTLGKDEDYDRDTGATGDTNEIDDIDTVEENAPNRPVEYLHDQIAHRRAAIQNLEEEIDRQTERVSDEMQSAQQTESQRARELRETVEENWPNYNADGISRAIQHIDENVETEHVPRGTTEKAMELLQEYGELGGPNEPRLPDHMEVRDVGDEGYRVYSRSGRAAGPARPTEIEAMVAAHNAGSTDIGHNGEIDLPEPEYDTETGGWSVGSGYNRVTHAEREDAVRDWVNQNWEPAENDDAWQNVRRDLDDYAEARAEYMRAESEHYWVTEGEAFQDERGQIGDHEEEIGKIEELIEEHAGDERALPAPEDAPNDPAENPYLMPIVPEVKGPAKYSSYQRIGGGANYRELLNVIENPPGDSYTASHYGNQGFPNVVGHVRAEDHALIETPDVSGQRVTYNAGEPEKVRLAKSKIDEVRQRRDEQLKAMDALVREYEKLADKEGEEAQALARKYGDHNNNVVNLSQSESTLLDDLRYKQGGTPSAEPVAVMIESQSDWAQDAGRKGVQRPLAPEERNRLSEQHAAAMETVDHLRGMQESAAAARDAAVEHYRALVRRYNDDARAHDAAETEINWRDLLPSFPDSYDTDIVAEVGRTHPEVRDAAVEVTTTSGRLRNLADELTTARNTAYEIATRLEGTGQGVPPTPFISGGTVKKGDRFDADGAAAYRLNAARFLIDSAERGYEQIAWSDAANRVKWAHLPMVAAKKVYDEITPSAMTSILAGLGFKDVKPDKVYIRGNGHWRIALTPAMREAIRKVGVPLLSVMALASAPKAAEAQDGTEGSSSIYGTIAGSVVAGAALMYLAQSRAARRLVAENRELSRALMVDDLTGLANPRAFRRAVESVDRDEQTSWISFDAERFKQINDKFTHAEGDKALAHFGSAIRETAEKLDVPMRGFRKGGDEFAFAVPAARAAEVMQAVEAASEYTRDGVTTRLNGAHAPTFAEADALLTEEKAARRDADPTKQRPSGGATLYANPIGPALRELRRVPSAAAVVALGTWAAGSDNPDIQKAGLPIIALGALHAIGSERLAAGRDALGTALIDAMRKRGGETVVRAFNPDALLSPEVRAALIKFEQGGKRAEARAREFSGMAKGLGPVGDRAASDVIEGEQWEDVSGQSPRQLGDILTVGAALEQEYEKAANAQVAAGAMDASAKLPNYAGRRSYAYHEAQAALDQSPTPAAGGSRPRVKATKSRTLDYPIRDAEDALRDAQASGDPKAIQDATDALDQAKVVQMSQRVELGEIREQSYRAQQTIERGYKNAEAATLYQTLANAPGSVHPAWTAAVSDLDAAKQLKQAAATPADRDAAQALIDQAIVKQNDLTRRFSRKDAPYVALPDTPGYGMLRGAIVQRDIANSLNHLGWNNAYTRLLQFWKEAKTVFNPGTSAANIVSNIAFSHMEGLGIHEQPIYLKRAAVDMKKYGDATRALAERGILENSAINTPSELAGRDLTGEAGLEALLPTTRPETKRVLEDQGITDERVKHKARVAGRKAALGGAAVGAAALYSDESPQDAAGGALVGAGAATLLAMRGGRSAARTFYQSEDNIFRVAIYLKRRAVGDTEAEAAAFTGKALGDFRSRSPALRVLRSSIAPFIIYPAKALPRFGKQMIDHPWRYLSLVAAWGALNEYSKKKVGEVPEGDLSIKDRRGPYGYFFPGFMQLPFTNDRGERGGVDFGRWMPTNALTSLAPPGSVAGVIDERTPDIFRAGGPVVDLASRFGANVDPYTNEPRFKPDYPPSENIGRLLNDAAETVLPQALGFHRRRLQEDMTNADWDKFKNDLLGPTGLKPRYIRPGGNQMGATFQLETSLRDMKHELTLDLRHNQNEEQVPVIRNRYLRRIGTALANYKDRLGVAPPRELVDEYLDETPRDTNP